MDDTTLCVAGQRTRTEPEDGDEVVVDRLDLVVDEEGQPLGDARVHVAHPLEDGEELGVRRRGVIVETQADGPDPLPEPAHRRETVVKISEVPGDGVRELRLGLLEPPGDGRERGAELAEQADPIEPGEVVRRVDPMPPGKAARRHEQPDLLVVPQGARREPLRRDTSPILSSPVPSMPSTLGLHAA